MGAALLSNIERASDILKNLVKNVPCQITCKIRLLDTDEKTIDFVKMCEMSGVSAIAVHLRQKHERPSHPASWSIMTHIKDAVSIPVIANGDFVDRQSVNTFKKHLNTDGFMFARGALWNPAIFWKSDEKPPTREEVYSRYVELCASSGVVYQNTKYVLAQMTQPDRNQDRNNLLQRSKTAESIYNIFKCREITMSDKQNTYDAAYYKDLINSFEESDNSTQNIVTTQTETIESPTKKAKVED
eukprot:GHVL01022697.1.p1 GENE.GHVL01022697.1~~GHVL01022697.1.p1  ORF type:complete len:243 (-),score=32.37 GHVL01022697.1:71-799(-)